MTQEKTNRNYKDSVFVDFLCRFSDKKIEKNNRLHEWQMSTQRVRMEYFRQEIPKANVNINERIPHSLDVYYVNISFVCVANSPTVHAIDSFSIRYFPLENISFACSMLTVSASRILTSQGFTRKSQQKTRSSGVNW